MTGHKPNPPPATAWDYMKLNPPDLEVRQTSTTGGEKGSKGTDFCAIPPDFLLALAAHFHDGCKKYPTAEDGLPNFWLGYPYSLNIEAMSRHWYLWLNGEQTIQDDDETHGNHHLLACIWHLIDLWRKDMSDDNQFDDRPTTAQEKREHA